MGVAKGRKKKRRSQWRDESGRIGDPAIIGAAMAMAGGLGSSTEQVAKKDEQMYMERFDMLKPLYD